MGTFLPCFPRISTRSKCWQSLFSNSVSASPVSSLNGELSLLRNASKCIFETSPSRLRLKRIICASITLARLLQFFEVFSSNNYPWYCFCLSVMYMCIFFTSSANGTSLGLFHFFSSSVRYAAEEIISFQVRLYMRLNSWTTCFFSLFWDKSASASMMSATLWMLCPSFVARVGFSNLFLFSSNPVASLTAQTT